jgi:hypothetical protein
LKEINRCGIGAFTTPSVDGSKYECYAAVVYAHTRVIRVRTAMFVTRYPRLIAANDYFFFSSIFCCVNYANVYVYVTRYDLIPRALNNGFRTFSLDWTTEKQSPLSLQWFLIAVVFSCRY